MEKFKALKNSEVHEFCNNSEPKCPHCGVICPIDVNDWYHLFDDGDDHEVVCPECDGIFTVYTQATYTFSTNNQEDYDESH